MATLFKKKGELTSSQRTQLKSLWLDLLCDDIDSIEPGKIDEKMDFIDDTIVAYITTAGGRKIIASTCLILPSVEDLESGRKQYEILKKNGHNGGKDVFLYNLCVRTKDQRKGLASKIMEDVEGYLKKKGWEKIILWVMNDNPQAINLYNKLGYNVKVVTTEAFMMEKKLI